MRITLTFLVSCTILLFVFSCKKSSNSSKPSNAVTGNWKFINMNVQSQTNATVGGGITTVTTANYITVSNAGTISFTTDTMTVSGLTYSVDTISTTIGYFNGVPTDTVTLPFSATLPATSAAVGYVLVSSDSLYFPNGGIAPTGLTSTGSGAHYVVNGDTLVLTSSVTNTTSSQVQEGTAVIKLLKQ